jgi:hypothetical protein
MFPRRVRAMAIDVNIDPVAYTKGPRLPSLSSRWTAPG